jgi:hypothetical protein
MIMRGKDVVLSMVVGEKRVVVPFCGAGTNEKLKIKNEE